MTNVHVFNNAPRPPLLPAVLDFHALKANFGIGRTTAYQLAAAGDIQSLTLGAPGKKGKRVFLTESIIELLSRRVKDSKPLKDNRSAKKKQEAV